MGINKYFVANIEYGQADINRIVSFLRTDGIYGEIENSLKVVATSGATVNVFSGIGWREGCMLELTSTEPYTLPTANGTYSVCIQLTKAGDTVTDIAIGHEAGEVSENYVLAWVTVSGGSIANVVDKRLNSTFKGVTQVVSDMAEWNAGDNVIFEDATEVMKSSTSYTKASSYKVSNSGTIKVSFDLWGRDVGKIVYARIYLNGVAIGAEKTTTGQTAITHQEIIPVSKGDSVAIYTKINSATRDNRVWIANVKFSINRGADVIQKVEG